MSAPRSLYLIQLRPAPGFDYSKVQERIAKFSLLLEAGSLCWYVVSDETMEQIRTELRSLLPVISNEKQLRITAGRVLPGGGFERTWEMLPDPDIERLFVIPVYREATDGGDPEMRALFRQMTGGN